MKVGVLALQGAFAKHLLMLHSLGVEAVEVRKPEDLASCQGLIMPGGESTTMTRQINFIKLTQPLKIFSETKPIFGTCAGLILISKEIMGDPIIPMGLMDVVVERNAFGRQAESFSAEIELNLKIKRAQNFNAVFIRAPRIRTWAEDVCVLAKFENEPVLVRQGRFLGSTFHPELTDNPAIHEYFLEMIQKANEKS